MNCPNCNKTNPDEATKCECGYVFKGYQEAPAPKISFFKKWISMWGWTVSVLVTVLFFMLGLINVLLIFLIPIIYYFFKKYQEKKKHKRS